MYHAQKYFCRHRWTDKSLRGIEAMTRVSRESERRRFIARKRESRVHFQHFHQRRPHVDRSLEKSIGGYAGLSSNLSSREHASKTGRGSRWWRLIEADRDSAVPTRILRPDWRVHATSNHRYGMSRKKSIWITTGRERRSQRARMPQSFRLRNRDGFN